MAGATSTPAAPAAPAVPSSAPPPKQALPPNQPAADQPKITAKPGIKEAAQSARDTIHSRKDPGTARASKPAAAAPASAPAAAPAADLAAAPADDPATGDEPLELEPGAEPVEGDEPLPGDEPATGDAPAAGDEPASGAAADDLEVELLNPREDGEPIKFKATTKEEADALRYNVKGAIRADEARQQVERAQQLRDEADEVDLTIEFDPAGAFDNLLFGKPRDAAHAQQQVKDREHLVKYALTRDPGFFEALRPWMEKMLDNPEAIPAEAELANSTRITRREAIRSQLAEERVLRDNARALRRTVGKTLETMGPAGLTQQGYSLHFEGLLREVRGYAQANRLAKVDPKVIPGLARRYFKTLGITPRGEGKEPTKDPARPGGGARPASVPAAAPAGRTPASFTASRDKRKGAGSAPPGAGSPVAAVPSIEKYDPKKPGTPIQQAAAAGRAFFDRIRRRGVK